MLLAKYFPNAQTTIPYASSSFHITNYSRTRIAFQEIFSRRLEAFYKSTSPLLQYYSARAARSAPPPPPTPSPTSKSLLHVSRIDSTYSDKTRPHVISLSGRTSDEIWPQLDAAVQHRFGVRARKVHPPVGQVTVTSVPKVEGVRQTIRSGSPA